MAQNEPPLVNYTNSKQFDTIRNTQTLLLFYGETRDGENVVLDPPGDAQLYELYAGSPYEFNNTRHQTLYETLVSRAYYLLRLHPNQELARELAAVQLSPEAVADLVIFVYRRDRAGTSPVRNRQLSPFTALSDGDDAPEVVLFRRYSFAPALRVLPVWRDEADLNATVGLLGVRVLPF